jgi:hypothetical protein
VVLSELLASIPVNVQWLTLITTVVAGTMERFHITLSQLGLDSCVAIVGEFTNVSGLTGQDKDWLYPALHRVILEHPALGVQIQAGDKGDVPKYVRLSAVDMDVVVHYAQDEQTSVEQLLRSELERPFELGTTSPLWRIAVAHGSSSRTRLIVFAYHHAIADGLSGPAFMSALLSALNEQKFSQAGYQSKVDVPTEPTIVGPLEAFTDISPSFSIMYKEAFKLLAPPSWKPGFYSWTGNPVMKIPSLGMSVRCWEISAAHTTKILHLCRENKTTFTAFLHTLVAEILSRLVLSFQGGQLSPYMTITTAVPVSLRRFTGASPFVLCDHVSSAYFHIPIQSASTKDPAGQDRSFPWATASEFGLQLQGSIETLPRHLGPLRLLFSLGQANAYVQGMLGKKRESSVTISNLGTFPLREAQNMGSASSWTIGSVYFAQCDVVRGAAIKVNVMGSPNGTTSVAFTWGNASIDAELVEKFIDDTKALFSSTVQ